MRNGVLRVVSHRGPSDRSRGEPLRHRVGRGGLELFDLWRCVRNRLAKDSRYRRKDPGLVVDRKRGVDSSAEWLEHRSVAQHATLKQRVVDAEPKARVKVGADVVAEII